MSGYFHLFPPSSLSHDLWDPRCATTSDMDDKTVYIGRAGSLLIYKYMNGSGKENLKKCNLSKKAHSRLE